MAEHTPGPWEIYKAVDLAPDGSRFAWLIVTRSSVTIAECNRRDDVDQSLPAEANARLIAAAPDLLAALEECRALMRADNPADGWADAITAADAALVKAKGETA